jgi:hypothetical protein
MNAHISHDIKNVTATVSETALLMEDLMAMQAQGGVVDPERLHKLLARIAAQVRRGNDLLGAMNYLAHSSDEPVSEVDVNRLAANMAQLARCVPAYRQVECVPAGDEPLRVTTRPYFVEEFVYWTYRACFEALPTDAVVELRVERDGDGCVLALEKLPDAPGLDKAMPLLEELAGLLDARVARDAARGRLELRLPAAVS